MALIEKFFSARTQEIGNAGVDFVAGLVTLLTGVKDSGERPQQLAEIEHNVPVVVGNKKEIATAEVTKSEIPANVLAQAMSAITPQFKYNPQEINDYSPFTLGQLTSIPVNVNGLKILQERQVEQAQMALA